MPTSRTRRDPWAEAIAHLAGTDAHWPTLIAHVGPCQLRKRPSADWFATLVRAIIGQQISAKAAASIDAKLRGLAGERHMPEPLIAIGETGLRSVGLSGVKARYVLNLSDAVRSGDVPLHKFGRWSDEAIIESLTSIKGIGVWTAQMFLIFAMNRPDVLPVADLGIRVALRDRFGLEGHPTPTECHTLTESWRPYRSVAMWYLWRSLDATIKAKISAASAAAVLNNGPASNSS
jgi:DNA-3-methyladenine glycosylase II